MSSVTIITDICRASYVHLKEPKKFNEKDALKYRLTAMFPKAGQGVIQKLGLQFPSSRDNLVNAIKQVVREEFGFELDVDNHEFAKQCGIQFPPNFKDGDKVFAKDEKGFPIPGQVDPIAAGNWSINFTANPDEQPGCVHGVSIQPIDPSAIYSGCWVRCQVEVSAFTNKENARIIAIKLLNVMMAYDDESFGGAGPKQDATSAFAGMAVQNSNLSAGVGQGSFQPMTPAAPIAPATPAATSKLVMNANSPYTYDVLTGQGWTDEQIVGAGYATITQVAPPAPPAPPAPSVPTTGKVIMNADSPYAYDVLKGQGWTDDDMITAGYAKPNFTNPM